MAACATNFQAPAEAAEPGAAALHSGVAGTVLDKGSIHAFIPYLCQSVRHGLQDMGVLSLTELWKRLESGHLRFEMKSPAAQKEGKVHDLHSFSTTLFSTGPKK